MNKNDFLDYEVPQVEVIEVEVEKGFAASGGVNGQWFGNEQDWEQA